MEIMVMGEAPEAAVEDGQVKFDDEKLIGMAFVMMGLPGG